MSNKKTLKMTKKNSKRDKSRKGGFFGWFKKKNENEIDYDYATMPFEYLQSLYQKDCKKHFGFIKNMSSKCRKINKEIQKKKIEERPTVNLNKSKINPYTYVNQDETDSETDDEDDDEDDKYPVNLVTRPYPQYSSNKDDDESFSDMDYRTHEVLTGNKPPPAYGYGGKRRRTKKHFIKRSIGKRSIKKGRKTRKY